MEIRLTDPPYMSFPFRMDGDKVKLAKRADHIRGQIEQVLFTVPGERVFRPEFGAGIKALLFEPNSSAIWQITKKRLVASLASALSGEADPKSIDVNVEGNEEKLEITVFFRLAAIDSEQSHTFKLIRNI